MKTKMQQVFLTDEMVDPSGKFTNGGTTSSWPLGGSMVTLVNGTGRLLPAVKPPPEGAGPRARAALAQARVPVTCIAGHVHWNTITTVDGITHLTQQSLTESFTTNGEPAGAYGMLELGDTVNWQVHGDDPISFSFKPGLARWTPPLPGFDSHPEFAARRRGQLK